MCLSENLCKYSSERITEYAINIKKNNHNNNNNCLLKYNVNSAVCSSTIKIRHNLKIGGYKWF